MKTKKLTFIESVMLVAGAGIGTGILTIPYAISKIGVFGTITALIIAYAVSAVMYLIIADLTRNSEKPEDLLAILDEHLFCGKGKKALNIAFLVLIVLLMLENLVVYILCAGNDLTHEAIDSIRGNMEAGILGQRGGCVHCHDGGAGSLGKGAGVIGHSLAVLRKVKRAYYLLQVHSCLLWDCR